MGVRVTDFTGRWTERTFIIRVHNVAEKPVYVSEETESISFYEKFFLRRETNRRFRRIVW
jgi:hypothetical protein